MEADKNSDTADSRTSAVGKRKRAAEQISREDSPDTDSSRSSSPATDRSQAKKAKLNDGVNESTTQSETVIKTEDIKSEDVSGDEVLNVSSQADPPKAAVTWNKGVVPTLRTSFGKTPIASKAPAMKSEPNQSTESNDVLVQNTATDEPSAAAASGSDTKTKAKKKKKEPVKTSIPSKLSFGEGKDSVYNLEANFTFCPSHKPTSWVKDVIRDSFIPELLKQNYANVKNLDEKKLANICGEFVMKENQLFSSPQLVEIGIKTMDSEDFPGYCKNQIKKAKLAANEEKKKADEQQRKAERKKMSKERKNKLAQAEKEKEKEEGEVEEPMLGKQESIKVEEAEPVRVPVPAASENAVQVDVVAEGPALAVIPPQTSEATPEEQADIVKYFPGIPPDVIVCLVCRDVGHTIQDCPHLTCEHCSAVNLHFSFACPKNFLCTKCRERGHSAKECSEKLQRSIADGVVCDICASVRHVEEHCPFLWRSFKPEKLSTIKKLDNMLVDCWSCGALGHSGAECGLRPNQMPYGGQTWSEENRNRYWTGQVLNGSASQKNGKMGMSIKGSAKQNAIYLGDSSEDEGLIRPPVSKSQPKPKPQVKMRLEDRITGGPNLNLPQYSQQPMSQRDYQNAMDNAPRYNGPAALSYNPGQPRLSDFDDKFSFQGERDDYRGGYNGGGGFRPTNLPNRPAPRQNANNQIQNRNSGNGNGNGRSNGGPGSNSGRRGRGGPPKGPKTSGRGGGPNGGPKPRKQYGRGPT